MSEMDPQHSALGPLRTEGTDFARVVAVAILEKDVCALAYALGKADAQSEQGRAHASTYALHCAPVVEAALKELGYFGEGK